MTKIEKLQARCVRCGTDVGCSCGLKNGLCSTCVAADKK